MNWTVIARREVTDLRRSSGIRVLFGLSVVVGVAAVLLPSLAVDDALSAEQALVFLVTPLKLVIGLSGLLAGYGAIAGPRTGGQLSIVLGLPIEREALVLGTFLGRVGIVLAGTAVTLGAVGGTLLAVYGAVPVRSLVSFGVLLGLLAATMTALAIGISAASPSHRTAAAAAIGTFVLFEFFWGIVPNGIYYLVEGSLPGPTVPPWVVLLERLQPLAAFQTATDLVLTDAEQTIKLSGRGAEAAESGAGALADRVTGDSPPYLDPWAGILTLVGWAVGPLLIGVYRFTHTDL